jgi:hypothetical protein
MLDTAECNTTVPRDNKCTSFFGPVGVAQDVGPAFVPFSDSMLAKRLPPPVEDTLLVPYLLLPHDSEFELIHSLLKVSAAALGVSHRTLYHVWKIYP